jgi:DNA-binding MarR family transcriptional regulator
VADQALGSWMRTLIGYVRSGEPDLTNRQMALMLVVYLTPGPHTVRGLAERLGVSKPVITRALNTLGALGYLRRVRDESDRRNVFVAKTGNGQDFLEGFERNLEQARSGHSAGSDDGNRSSGGGRSAGERGLLFQNG